MTPRQQRSSYTPEFRAEAVRQVIETSRPIVEVARELGVYDQTFSTGVSRYKAERTDTEAPLTGAERTRLTAAEKEVRDLRLELEFLKKSRSVLREGSAVIAKYACIDDIENGHPRRFGIRRMCQWLGVSSSGFFYWRTRAPSATALRRVELGEYVRWSFDRSGATYGHRRIHADLEIRGIPIGLDLVRELMTEADLVACQPRPFRVTTMPGEGEGPQDLCRRDFTATAPGTKLVSDITYIHTWEGFAYLATVIDCHSRAVIGWSAASHMRTTLIIDALDMARRNHTISPECIFHSDRGTQYTSEELRKYLEAATMRGSMGRTGICWDNALAESFFAGLKNELVYRTAFPTIKHATRAVAKYIEIFYNRQRLHSGLGYRTPLDVQTSHKNQAIAA